jgi:membrane associated rhomboid family serine protease
VPLHAQILCIGGNALFAFFFLIAAGTGFGAGDYGLAFFLSALAVAAIYTCWVLLKFRRYLGAEAALERELHIERLREEIDQLKANNAPQP